MTKAMCILPFAPPPQKSSYPVIRAFVLFLFLFSLIKSAHTNTKKSTKSPSAFFSLPQLFLFCSICFCRVFRRFVTRKKVVFPQQPKKIVTYLRHFFLFPARPLVVETPWTWTA
jgi:hypothetical protein